MESLNHTPLGSGSQTPVRQSFLSQDSSTESSPLSSGQVTPTTAQQLSSSHGLDFQALSSGLEVVLAEREAQAKKEPTAEEHNISSAFGSNAIDFDKGREALQDSTFWQELTKLGTGASWLTTALKTAVTVLFFPISLIVAGVNQHNNNAAKALLRTPTADITLGMRFLSDINALRARQGEPLLDLKDLLENGKSADLLSGAAPVGSMFEVFDHIKSTKGGDRLDTIIEGLRKWDAALKQVAEGTDFDTDQALTAVATQNLFDRNFSTEQKAFAADQVSSLWVNATDTSGQSVAVVKFADKIANEYKATIEAATTPEDYGQATDDMLRAIETQANIMAEIGATNTRYDRGPVLDIFSSSLMMDEISPIEARAKELTEELHTELVTNPTFRAVVKSQIQARFDKVAELRDFGSVQQAIAVEMTKNLRDIATIDTSKGSGEEILATRLSMMKGLSRELQHALSNITAETDLVALKAQFAETVTDSMVDSFVQQKQLYKLGRAEQRNQAVDHYFGLVKAGQDVQTAFQQATAYLANEANPGERALAQYNPDAQERLVDDEFAKLDQLSRLLDPRATRRDDAKPNMSAVMQELAAANDGSALEFAPEVTLEQVQDRHNLKDPEYANFFKALIGVGSTDGSATFAHMLIGFMGAKRLGRALNIRAENMEQFAALLGELTKERLSDGQSLEFETVEGKLALREFPSETRGESGKTRLDDLKELIAGEEAAEKERLAREAEPVVVPVRVSQDLSDEVLELFDSTRGGSSSALLRGSEMRRTSSETELRLDLEDRGTRTPVDPRRHQRSSSFGATSATTFVRPDSQQQDRDPMMQTVDLL